MELDQKKELEELHDWFQHPGWKTFERFLEADKERSSNLAHIETEKQLNFSKGVIHIITTMQLYPEYVRNALGEAEDAV